MKNHPIETNANLQKKTAMALILRRYQPMVGWLVSFFLVGYTYLYTPRTQMTLVSIEKGLVLEGLPSKIEVSWVLGIYIYMPQIHWGAANIHSCTCRFFRVKKL